MSLQSIRIASRSSKLALWQTETVKRLLEGRGLQCSIIPIESTGDIDLKQPIYQLGVTGVFTKQLDIALLNNQADIAVHSLKDVPTQLAENLLLAAVLERGPYEDVIIAKNNEVTENEKSASTIATGSLRRKAQWLSKYPNHTVVPIRGNVQTRLKKYVEDNDVKGVIFAKAGLQRLDLLPSHAKTLDWMLPAPAQGIIGIVCKESDKGIISTLKKMNHQNSFIEGSIERQFLRTLMGGCSVPISALAKIKNDKIEFKGAVHSFNGSKSFWVTETIDLKNWEGAGKYFGEKILQQNGAGELINLIRNKEWK